MASLHPPCRPLHVEALESRWVPSTLGDLGALNLSTATSALVGVAETATETLSANLAVVGTIDADAALSLDVQSDVSLNNAPLSTDATLALDTQVSLHDASVIESEVQLGVGGPASPLPTDSDGAISIGVEPGDSGTTGGEGGISIDVDVGDSGAGIDGGGQVNLPSPGSSFPSPLAPADAMVPIAALGEVDESDASFMLNFFPGNSLAQSSSPAQASVTTVTQYIDLLMAENDGLDMGMASADEEAALLARAVVGVQGGSGHTPTVELGEEAVPALSTDVGVGEVLQPKLATAGDIAAMEQALREFLDQLPGLLESIRDGLARLGPWPWVLMSLALVGVTAESLRRLQQLRRKLLHAPTLEDEWSWAWRPELGGIHGGS